MASGTIGVGRPIRLTPVNERQDRWWIEPLLVVLGLGSLLFYAGWAGIQNAYYYADPYLSPLYSPCLASICQHVTFPLVGAWWTLSPALLVIGIPVGFRGTCYYLRRAYYRSFFSSPPGCAVPDMSKTYRGETAFPFILQNVHRYFFWLALILVILHWGGVIESFQFGGSFGMGVGTLVMLADAVLLTGYSLSCHSCRHIFGGGLDLFSSARTRYKIWGLLSRMNEQHMLFFWLSLGGVMFTDLYVRAVAMGVIHDVRFF